MKLSFLTMGGMYFTNFSFSDRWLEAGWKLYENHVETFFLNSQGILMACFDFEWQGLMVKMAAFSIFFCFCIF